MTQITISDTDVAFLALDFISAASDPEKTKTRLEKIAAEMAKVEEAHKGVAEDAAFVRRNKDSLAKTQEAQTKLETERAAQEAKVQEDAGNARDRLAAAAEAEAKAKADTKEALTLRAKNTTDRTFLTRFKETLDQREEALVARENAISEAAKALKG